MIREETLTTVHHPEFIDSEWQRVDHPVLAPLAGGAPELGFEGDARLVVYLHLPTQRFTLWRLEHDGEYRPVAQLPEGAALTTENVNALCVRLVEIDARNGFDPYDSVMDALDARDRENIRVTRDAVHAFADEFHYLLSRAHLPGIWAYRIRNAPTKR